jgi:hypothetical protein
MWKNMKKDTTEIVYDNKNFHRRCAQWNHSGYSFTEMFAFIKRNKSDAKFFASQNLYDIFSDLRGHFMHTVRHVHNIFY